jgi:hypothetical protein
MLKEDYPNCRHHMPGNVWDGTGGPVANPNSPAWGASGSAAAAESSATRLADLANEEQQINDIAQGFLGTSTGAYVAPKPALYGQRPRQGAGYVKLAAANKAEAELLKPTDKPAKADPNKTYQKPVEPKVDGIKAPASPEAEHIAARSTDSRLKANGYSAAHLEAMARFRAAKAANDKDAMFARAKEAVLCAVDSLAYAQAAADDQRLLDQNIVKAIDEALAAAAKKGTKLPELLEKFQAEVKEKGLPQGYKDALKAAGATDAELDAARGRLLALKPAQVEKTLNLLRARGAESRSHAPDWLVLYSQFSAALKQFDAIAKPDKK